MTLLQYDLIRLETFVYDYYLILSLYREDVSTSDQVCVCVCVCLSVSMSVCAYVYVTVLQHMYLFE